jgi:hypothetical protein
MPRGRMSKVSQICVALTMVAAPAVLAASPASASGVFSNATPIGLQDPGTTLTNPAQAVAYPSTISVSGQTGSINALTVTLSGITYPDPQALSVLLVGPGGSLVLLSGAGGTSSATGVNVTLSDSASNFLPAAPSSGTYRPTADSSVSFPSPAPVGGYGTPAPQGSATLASTFAGTNPNGTWSLYVTTDVAGAGANTGSISSWSLDITTNPGPVVNAGGTVTFTGGGSPVTLDAGLTVADPSATTIHSAEVSIATGLQPGDRLDVASPSGLIALYSSGVLTLTGTASLATYQAALDSVTYSFSPSDGDPTDGGNDTSRTIDWSVNDGSFTSSTASSSLVTQTNTIVVNACTDSDAGSGNSGDLLYAVTEANANPGSTITFDPSLSCPDNTITLSSTLDITSSVTITGPGASALAVSGGNNVGVFQIEAGPTTISGLTITDGYTTGSGAGVADGSGSLTLDNDTISDDTSSDNLGGGVYFYFQVDTTTLTLDNDTFSGDTASQGGGLYQGCVAPCATATLDNDTFSGDTADNGGHDPGGAILDDGPNATLDDDTFSDDTSTTGGEGIYVTNGTVTISNSILDNSPCGGNLTDGGYNVESDDTCGLSGSDTPPSVVNSTTIGLATSLAANGSSGPETLAIGPGSSAFEEVPTTPTNSCTLTTDERDSPRPGVPGQACDAGAYESQALYAYADGAATTPTSCPEDTNDPLVPADECDLAQALALAVGGETLYLATPGGSGTGEADYSGNWTVDPPSTSSTEPLTIQPAPGITNPTLDGNQGKSTGCTTATCTQAVLTVGANVYLNVLGLTIQNGHNTNFSFGGAINNDQGGTLTVSDASFIGNTSVGDAGAINNGVKNFPTTISGVGTLTISGSTFDDNSATSAGGAIDNGDADGVGTLVVTDSTFVDNSAPYGGAIYDGAEGATGDLTVTASTFSGNTATTAGPDIDDGKGGYRYGPGRGGHLRRRLYQRPRRHRRLGRQRLQRRHRQHLCPGRDRWHHRRQPA